VHSLGGVLASLIWIGMARAWAAVLTWISGVPGGLDAIGRDGWGLLFLAGVLLFWLAVVLHYLLIAFESSRDAERQTFELRLLARESELRALRAQLDPHFIFNSLHSISALTTRDPAAARRMCLLLAEFLRDTLRLGSHARISLAEEVRLAERFLAIEEVRLGPRLQFVSEVPEAAGRCLVPPLLLQPVVENAVVHGVAQTVDGGTIRLSAACSEAMLTVAVENPCDADAPRRPGGGLGLELLRRRLTTHFGAYDPLRTTEREGRFLVEIRLPAEVEDVAPEARNAIAAAGAAAEGQR
jgi:LytS/YehU family sensor histidine kinase